MRVSPEPSAAGDRNLPTEQQVLTTDFTTPHGAVLALRSNWPRTRSMDRFAAPTPVWVSYDNAQPGGVEAPRSLAPQSVTYVRYHDGLAASARWGVGHGRGVIFVSIYPQ